MTMRSLLIASALLAATAGLACAQSQQDAAGPVLRASVTVTSDIVRIGDVVENAGAAAQIAIFRAPDLGTTGAVPVAQVLATLRAHQVIGVNARDLREVAVTRAARTLLAKDIERQITRVLERRNGLGDAANLAVTFDRELRDLNLDTANSGELSASAIRFDPRSGRFDITFDIQNDDTYSPTRLRFTGTAVETVEAAVLTRSVERNDILKASDIAIERRPKTEAGSDAALRERAVGLQMRRQMRAGQVIKMVDLGKPDLVTRDQNITLIYDAPGVHLTGRGKAMDSGTLGDTVNVMNTQSKRVVQGTVTGPGQVAIIVATSSATINTAALAATDSSKAE
jgi:flagella basal body P-ring formation protein FlgA